MLAQSIELLQRLTLPGSTTTALTFLERIVWYAKMQPIKNHFFPEELPEFNKVQPVNTSQELAFYQLINQRLFPIPEPMLNGEDIFDQIPAWPYYSNWYDSEFNELPKSFQLVVYLCGGVTAVAASDWLQHISVYIPDDWEFDSEILTNLCSQHDKPLIIFPMVLQIIEGETGNVWLDANSESYLEFEWTIENMEMLSEHWDGAKFIVQQIEELDQWLSEPNNLDLLLEIWRSCYVSVQKPKPQPLMVSLRDLYNE